MIQAWDQDKLEPKMAMNSYVFPLSQDCKLFPNNSTGESYTLQQLDKAWEWDRANGMEFIYKLLDLMNRNYSIESVKSHLIDRYISRAQTICSPK